MLKQKTKVIEIGQDKYRLSKLDARSASYLCMKVAAIIAPALPIGGAAKDDMTKDDVISFLCGMPRKEFDELQTMLLKTVCKLEDAKGADMPVPILNASGNFVDADLAYDARTVMALTAAATWFNIGSFFQEPALLQTMKAQL